MYNIYNTGPKYTTATVICPTWSVIGENKELRENFEKLWLDMELGNDHYYVSTDREAVDEGEYDDYPHIKKFIQDEDIKGDILLHYWW